VIVLAVWWFHTSVKRRAERKGEDEDEDDGSEPTGDGPHATAVDPAARIP